MSTKLLLFILVLLSSPILFAQEKDSLTLEMERLNRLGDSMYKERLKRESTFQDMLNNTAREIENIKNKANEKAVAEATQEVLRRHEKEQASKRKIYWIGFIILLVIATVSGVYLQRKKNKG